MLGLGLFMRFTDKNMLKPGDLIINTQEIKHVYSFICDLSEDTREEEQME